MSKLELENGIRSQILRIIVTVGQASIEIVDSNRLYYEDEKTSNFEDILIKINNKCSNKLIPIKDSQEIINFISSAIKSSETNSLQSFCNKLNELLTLQTYIIGNQLSAADIACYITIYSFYSNINNKQRYYDNNINISRWFDNIQFRINKYSNLLKPIIIKKSVAINQQNQQKQQKQSKSQQQKPKSNKKNKKNKKKKLAGALTDHTADIPFIDHRLQLFNEIWERQCLERQNMNDTEIDIKLPDGTIKKGIKFKTTPLQIAESISKSLAKQCIVAKINNNLWDLTRPFEDNCDLELLKWDNDDAKHVFWHSSSHVLGQSMETMLKGKLTIGPALDPSQMIQNGGFYYDVSTKDLGNNLKLSQSHYGSLESKIQKILKEKQKFQRISMTRQEAETMFKFNKYKKEIISDIYDGNKKDQNQNNSYVTAYRCGSLIDLCTGPHIPHTGLIKAMKITKNGATYWKNDNKNDFLQRLYGVSFPNKDLMKEYEKLKAEAEKADHRKIGKDQKLFFFNELSPGSCFWLPHGTRIYEKLKLFISNCYRDRGFTQVISPNVYNFDLWKISGHAKNYSENMFLFECEEQQYGMKPMNCPGHCLMFAHHLRSYRDLPIRFADFGALHRNELSGSLTGLTRVRRFQQDDAHIFCRHDQIEQEIDNCLDFVKHVYGVFNFKFELELSTRPLEKYLGDPSVWDKAEAQLTDALNKFCNNCNNNNNDQSDQKNNDNQMKWKLNEGDGAFYGPKIDIKVFDSLHREHQCATIQLDFQLPLRFGLTYTASGISSKKIDNKTCLEIHEPELEHLRKKYLHSHDVSKMKNTAFETPVIIHRAIYGSFERFIAILTEHLLGKWPFWISPRQICIIPVTKQFNDYSNNINKILLKNNYWCDVDNSKDRLPKKIRKAQESQYNFILVVGKNEIKNNTVNVRTRDNIEHGEINIDNLLKWLKKLTNEYK